MTEKRIRITLAGFCSFLTVVLSGFAWIMMDASSEKTSYVLLRSLILISGVTLISQIIYSFKGQIFEYDGRPAKNEIMFSVICFQLIMQFGFGFSLFAVNQTAIQNESYDAAYSYFLELRQTARQNTVSEYKSLNLTENMPEYVENVFVIAGEDSNDINKYFHFPVDGGMLIMKKSQQYLNDKVGEFAVNLLMSMVISVLLMIELVLFAMKYLNKQKATESSSVEEIRGDAAGYLRQFAFLFFFAGFLGTPFIAVIARNLCEDSTNANFIAGLPYSAEALANCVAILFATRLFRKSGWKPPYLLGVGIFVLGIVFSATAENIIIFIIARAVVGIGYGLCWMTLRNITTISGNRAENFSGLTSGIYAGIMCAAAFGTVLADTIGFRNVLFVSAVLSAAAAIFPLMMKNEFGEKNLLSKEKRGKLIFKRRDVAVFAVLLVTIVIPTCISEAFCSYAAPLYIDELQLPAAYIGRISLLYNLCIVYISSTLLIRIVLKIKNLLLQNIMHLILISAAFIICGHFGGFYGIIITAAILGSADGFGFSVQNAYILETGIAKSIGITRMFTAISLFKKFGVVFGPAVFSLFMADGIAGLGSMGLLFIVCVAVGFLLIPLLQKIRT